MDTLYQIMGLLGAGLIMWLLFRTIKGRPEVFNRENMSKSATSMGVLAILLIVFIALLVLIVRNT